MGLFDYMFLVPREELIDLKSAAARGEGEASRQHQENNLSVVIRGDCEAPVRGGGGGCGAGGGRVAGSGVSKKGCGGKKGRRSSNGRLPPAVSVPFPASHYPIPHTPGSDSGKSFDGPPLSSHVSERSGLGGNGSSGDTMDWKTVSAESRGASSSKGGKTVHMETIEEADELSRDRSFQSQGDSVASFSPKFSSTKIAAASPPSPLVRRKVPALKRKGGGEAVGSPFMKRFRLDGGGGGEEEQIAGKKRRNTSQLKRRVKLSGGKGGRVRSFAAGDLQSLIRERVLDLQGKKSANKSLPSSFVLPECKSSVTEKEREMVHQLREAGEKRGLKRTREMARLRTGGRVGKQKRECGEGEQKRYAFNDEPVSIGKKRLYQACSDEEEMERQCFPEKRTILSKIIEDDDWPM